MTGTRIQAKICGVSEPAALNAAVDGGAAFVGFVFFPRSPRNVSPPQAADLARLLPTAVRSVGLFVDPSDDLLADVTAQVPFDLLQLHGKETPERLAAIKTRFRLPVMKAFKIGEPADLDAAAAYFGVADRLLFDAKPPADAPLPGGNGVAFDWTLLAGRTWPKPWMLSGGLNAGNVRDGVAATGAPAVDVSSGVETAPGRKSPEMIRAFLQTVAGI